MISGNNPAPESFAFPCIPDMDYSQLLLYNAPIVGAGNGSVRINQVNVSCNTPALSDIEIISFGITIKFSAGVY